MSASQSIYQQRPRSMVVQNPVYTNTANNQFYRPRVISPPARSTMLQTPYYTQRQPMTVQNPAYTPIQPTRSMTVQNPAYTQAQPTRSMTVQNPAYTQAQPTRSMTVQNPAYTQAQPTRSMAVNENKKIKALEEIVENKDKAEVRKTELEADSKSRKYATIGAFIVLIIAGFVLLWAFYIQNTKSGKDCLTSSDAGANAANSSGDWANSSGKSAKSS